MFFRIKRTQNREYLQIVENTRLDGKPRQKVLATLGRCEALAETGQLDRLLLSGAKLSQTIMLLSAHRAGQLDQVSSRRIGAPLVFERLWRDSGCRAVVEALLAERSFAAPIERAIFASVLHRLVAPGSDRACERWLDAYHLAAGEDLQLQHLYRAMAWLGEELEDQADRTRAARCTKDLIEEQLFARRRDLFSDLDLVFFDTSSISFYGQGGETLGRRGKSKNHRPDLRQVVIGVVIDQAGRPICSETWPGNTADVTALLPVVQRLLQRFAIERVCVVGDRGMISKHTMAELEAAKIDYILATRERVDNEVRHVVLADAGPMTPLSVPRAGGDSTDIEVKQVIVKPSDNKPSDEQAKPRRYVVCFNPQQAKRDAAVREATLDSLKQKLKQGDKALVGNAGFRRYLSRGGRFEIDPERVREDARYDGLYVLRTNSTLPTLEVALRYRQLWMVEEIFRTTKAILETQPVFHSSNAGIRGHLFCAFLALVLRKHLEDRLQAAGVAAEWQDIVRDLDRIEEITVAQADKRFILRTQAPGCGGAVCQAVGVALPPLYRPETEPGSDPSKRRKPRKLRLTPRRRSATE